MENSDFIQNSSLIRWLRVVILAVAAFILLGILVQYLATTPFLKTVQRINEANKVLNFTSQSIELLNSSKSNLDSAQDNKDYNSVRVAFLENQKILNFTLHNAILESEKFSETTIHLKTAQEQIKNYETSAEKFLERLKNQSGIKDKILKDRLASELIVINEYYSDVKEQLLRSQITLKKVSDDAFSNVYNTRYRPLMISVVLALIFFSYVLVAGLSLTRRIRESILNLTGATDVVANGNLKFRAPVLRRDEIGKLTFAFNEMVSSLDESQEELSKLHKTRLDEERERTLFIVKNAERLNTIIESSLDAVIGMNENGVVTNWNSQAEKIFGYQKNEALGSLLAELIIPLRYRHLHAKGLEHFLTTGEGPILNQRIELSSIYRGSREFPVELAIVPVQDNGHWLFYAFIRDISDRKEIEKRQKALLAEEHHAREVAEQTVNMQDDFLSIAAHELKTPITPISMQLQLLERTIVKISEEEFSTVTKNNLLRLAHNSKKEIDRLSRLIEELLDVSRITVGRLILNIEEVNLSQILQSQIERYSEAAQKSGSVIHTSIQPDIIGNWDFLRLESMVENLITNAIKYGNGKPVEVKLELKGKIASLIVKDHGIGISRDDQERVFKKFERAASLKNYNGLGLGLYITREIVHAFHGTIKLESIIDEGSTFTVELPLLPSLQ